MNKGKREDILLCSLDKSVFINLYILEENVTLRFEKRSGK